MASRDSYGNGGGGQGTSPSDRAIAAYEERFFQTANSNDSKRRMLEERMTRPTPSTGITAGDALNASNAGANDQPDSDDDEQNAFRVEPKRARRGPGGSGHANNGARGVATSPLGDKERATPGSAGGRGSIDTYYKRVDGVPPAPAFGTSPTHGVGGRLGRRCRRRGRWRPCGGRRRRCAVAALVASADGVGGRLGRRCGRRRRWRSCGWRRR